MVGNNVMNRDFKYVLMYSFDIVDIGDKMCNIELLKKFLTRKKGNLEYLYSFNILNKCSQYYLEQKEIKNNYFGRIMQIYEDNKPVSMT